MTDLPQGVVGTATSAAQAIIEQGVLGALLIFFFLICCGLAYLLYRCHRKHNLHLQEHLRELEGYRREAEMRHWGDHPADPRGKSHEIG